MTEHNEQSSTPVGDSIPEVHVENVDLGIPTETQSTEQNEEPKDTEPQPTIAFRRYEGEQQHTGILNTSMVRKGTGKPSIAEVAMYLPSDALDSSNDLIVELNEITDEDPLLADEQGVEWLLTASAAQVLHENHTVNQKALEHGAWGNYIEHLTQRLRVGRPSFGNGNQPLTGARAAAKIAAVTSVGGVVQIPLYKAGFWVSIKAPSDTALNEARRLCEQQKEDFGRRSNGRTRSLTDVYSRKPLIDLAIRCIYDATVAYQDPQELYELIPFDEHEDLLWGVGLALYTQGFPMSRACTANVGVCKDVERAYVDLSEFQRVRTDLLTEKQKIHMANRTKRATIEQVAAYRAEFLERESGDDLSVFRFGDMSLAIVEPSIRQWVDDGFQWVRELELSVEAAFTGKMSAKERDAYITEQAGLSSLRQYSHYVSRITFYTPEGTEDGYIEDPVEIALHLGGLTGNTEFNSKFLDHIDRFFAARAVTVIAIWNYVCPKCGGEQSDHHPNSRYLIPISPLKTFFTILTHKLKTTTRNASVS